ncbi:MAG: peptidylprolyl isomerase [Verrucomicrobiae bacterium]|nr:peptidylprolyl isomerase [Verrucomicrobiae bacterium]
MNPRIVSFHYKMTSPQGDLLDSSDEQNPLTIIEGRNQIFPVLEAELLALKVGEKKRIVLKAADAYGPHRQELVFRVTKDDLPATDVHVGDRFRTHNSPLPLVVTEVTETHVTLDANHPLAGVDLTFDVEITEMRTATDEELAGCGGCCGDPSRGCCGH